MIHAIAVLLAVVLVMPAIAGDLPDAKKTPGLADPSLTQARLCSKAFRTGSVRSVSVKTKRAICVAYGLPADCFTKKTKAPNGPYEIDHKCAITDGGSNNPKNLWAQSYVTKPWNAHRKDALEVRLHSLMCKGALTLADVQRAICSAPDWRVAYRKYVGKP